LETLKHLQSKESGKTVAILGTMGELGKSAQESHRQVALKAAATGVACALFCGEYAGEMRNIFRTNASQDQFSEAFDTPETLLAEVDKYVSKGDCVLLKASALRNLRDWCRSGVREYDSSTFTIHTGYRQSAGLGRSGLLAAYFFLCFCASCGCGADGVCSLHVFRQECDSVASRYAPEVYTPEWAKNTPGESGAKKAEEAVKEALKKKHGVPSMGGILIVGVMDVSALFWGVWNELLLLTVLSMIVLAGLGFYDDYRKVMRAGRALRSGLKSVCSWLWG
jgi:hypothetical protein